MVVFFFSSRRRHTRWTGDWSSDVCSSDLFGLGSVIAVIIGMGMFGGIVCLPLYLQIVKGATPTRAGLLLIPATFGIMLGSVIAGQTISRTGRYKVFPVIGC